MPRKEELRFFQNARNNQKEHIIYQLDRQKVDINTRFSEASSDTATRYASQAMFATGALTGISGFFGGAATAAEGVVISFTTKTALIGLATLPYSLTALGVAFGASYLTGGIMAAASLDYIENRNGWSALHFAAEKGCDDVAIELIYRGANPSTLDDSGRTYLDIARRHGRANFLRKVFNWEDQTRRDYLVENTALQRTCYRYRQWCIELAERNYAELQQQQTSQRPLDNGNQPAERSGYAYSHLITDNNIYGDNLSNNENDSDEEDDRQKGDDPAQDNTAHHNNLRQRSNRQNEERDNQQQNQRRPSFS